MLFHGKILEGGGGGWSLRLFDRRDKIVVYASSLKPVRSTRGLACTVPVKSENVVEEEELDYWEIWNRFLTHSSLIEVFF